MEPKPARSSLPLHQGFFMLISLPQTSPLFTNLDKGQFMSDSVDNRDKIPIIRKDRLIDEIDEMPPINEPEVRVKFSLSLTTIKTFLKKLFG